MTGPGGRSTGTAGDGTKRDVLVDLGRSHVRVVSADVDVRTGRGAGLGDVGGPRAAASLVVAAIRAALPAVESSVTTATGIERLGVCAPGVLTAPDLAQLFADELAAAFPTADVSVRSDSAAWHAGAFGGRDGAVVALGTGAVVVMQDAGRVTRLDGRGLLLGDVGGGAWIGLHALRAAADRSDTVLTRAATARFGPASDWPSLLGTGDLAARLAAFVPDVVDAATAGDAAAAQVLDAAARGVATTLAAASVHLPTCLVGGVAALLADRLCKLVPRTWTTPDGDAVDGLRTLLADPGPFAPEVVHGRPAADRNQPSSGVAMPGHDTDRLPTEAVAPDTTDLDTWPTDRLVGRLVRGHEPAVRAVLDAVPALGAAVDLAASALGSDGRLVYVGAGTPGRLAVQDAAELTPTFGLDPARVPVLLAGGPAAGSSAIEGAEDDRSAAQRAIDEAGVGPSDVVVGVSASGRTPFVRAALHAARERGARTVAVCNVPASPVAAEAEVAVELLTGPEVIAGSTRLAAGTAQKIALNTLSTATLVRAGKTFGPWMVDMVMTNDKLRRRAVRIVRDLSHVTDSSAEDVLNAAGHSVPVALVMVLGDVDADTAREQLAATGSVRAAVEASGRRPGHPGGASS